MSMVPCLMLLMKHNSHLIAALAAGCKLIIHDHHNRMPCKYKGSQATPTKVLDSVQILQK